MCFQRIQSNHSCFYVLATEHLELITVKNLKIEPLSILQRLGEEIVSLAIVFCGAFKSQTLNYSP